MSNVSMINGHIDKHEENNPERDRLIELLNIHQDYGTKHFHAEETEEISSMSNELIADYLLSNGVIVPPCKNGDRVYLVREDTQKIYTCIINAIIQRITFQYAEVFIEEDRRNSLICLSYWGERLFPTKEEALSKLQASCKQVKGE